MGKAGCRGVYRRLPRFVFLFFLKSGRPTPKINRIHSQNALPRYSSGFGSDGSGS